MNDEQMQFIISEVARVKNLPKKIQNFIINRIWYKDKKVFKLKKKISIIGKYIKNKKFV